MRRDARGGLIASAVGTGKTAVVLTYLLERATPQAPALVIVPPSVEAQWAAEFKRVRATHPVFEGCVLWRCRTVTESYRPPPQWCILLVTYSFVQLRAEELRNNAPTFDMQEWVRVAPEYARVHNLATALHDRVWQCVVYDEANDGAAAVHPWVVKFMNTIPAVRVWAMTATPGDTWKMTQLLRMTLRVHVEALRAVTSQDVWAHALLACTFRVSSHVMDHTVLSQVVSLQLSSQERDVLEYARMRFRNSRDLLVCTDVQALMQELINSHHGSETPTLVTASQFWDTMTQRVSTQLGDHARRVAELETKLTDITEVEAALQGDADVEQARVYVTRTLVLEREHVRRLEDQSQFINNLKERVATQSVNPCPICMDTIAKGACAVTPCGHVFCNACILAWVRMHERCPMCRQPVCVSSVHVLVCDGAVPQDEGEWSNYSTKIRYLLTQVRVMLHSGDDKAIVFCDFPDTMHKIQRTLTAEGFVTTNLTGNVHCKNKKLTQFRVDPMCRVMFLHTGTHHSGLDLYNANHIFFVNPTSREVMHQAVGRCLRLTQTKPVHVVSLVVPEVESMPDGVYS